MKKNLLILAFILLIGFIVNSCGDDKEKPIPCICPDEATHLEEGEIANCPGEPCKHICIVKINKMLDNGKTNIIKEIGVDVIAFNEIVNFFNSLFPMFNNSMRDSFNDNIKEIRIMPNGFGISHQEKILLIGVNEDLEGDVIDYLLDEELLVPSGYVHNN